MWHDVVLVSNLQFHSRRRGGGNGVYFVLDLAANILLDDVPPSTYMTAEFRCRWEPSPTIADPSCLSGGNTHNESVIRHVMSHHGPGRHKGIPADCDSTHDGRIGSNRCSSANHGAAI